MDKYIKHEKICKELNAMYRAKNTAYNDAFGKTFDELGIISALTRMTDKFNRIKALVKGAEDNGESLRDSLNDLANYTIMCRIEIEKENDEKLEKLEETCKKCPHYLDGDEVACIECDKVSVKTMIRDMQMWRC